jgi:hypothetical protein
VSAVRDYRDFPQAGKALNKHCESRVTHIDYGDVEHYRPKGGYVQAPGHLLQSPGYYWLAYDWSNLLLSCCLCNQRHKANLFPLLDATARAICHRDDVAGERPVFINPATENPTEFIGFNQEYPFGIDALGRGESTIKALGLDREELAEMRRKRLEEARRTIRTVRVLRHLRERDGQLCAELAQLLREHELAILSYGDPSTEYLAMLRALLATEGLLGTAP